MDTLQAPMAEPADKNTILKDVFGFDDFRPGQKNVIDT